MKLCSFPGCGKTRVAKGLCPGHRAQQKQGKELHPLRPWGQEFCSFPGCDKPHTAKGLCTGHYGQQNQGRELRPLGPPGRVPVTFDVVLVLERRYVTDDGCWEWRGRKDKDGYGHLGGGRVHCLSFACWDVPIGEGVYHHCDNPACFRPTHLFTGTQAENLADRDKKGRSAAKLSWEIVGTIRARAAAGEKQRSLAVEYGVTEANVSLIVNARTWNTGNSVE